VLQLQEDVLEELEGDVLGGRETLSLDGSFSPAAASSTAARTA